MMGNKKDINTKQLRLFGLIVGGIFAFIGLWPMLFRGEDPHLWSLVIGVLLAILAIILPRSLSRIYQIWIIIGNALGWVNTRVILALGFYGIFTPMGLALRLLGKDPMRRKFDPTTNTYRVLRSSRPGSHMHKQF